MSTYESLLSHYKLTDERLIYIGRIIHDIEINIWEKKVIPETIKVREAVCKIMAETEDAGKIIEQGNAFFDSLYESLSIEK